MRSIKALFLVLFIPQVAFAGGGGGGGGLQDVFDARNYDVNKDIRGIMQQVKNELNTIIQFMQLNQQRHDEYSSQDITMLLSRLKQAVNKGLSISYTLQNIDGVFSERFPGYEPVEDFRQAQMTWTQTTLDTIRGHMDALNVQYQDFEDEEAIARVIENAAKASGGIMKVLDSMTMVNIQMLKQMKKQRQLAMGQLNSQAVHMANEVNQKIQTQATIDEWLSGGHAPVPNYNSNSQGGVGWSDRWIPPVRN